MPMPARTNSQTSPAGRTDRRSVAARLALLDALGLACYVSYSYVFWDSPLLLNRPGAGPMLLWQGVFTALAALVLMLVWGRVAPLRRNLPVMAAFTVMESAAVALAALGSSPLATVLALVGFATSGAGSAMRLGWEERFAVRGVPATAVRVGGAYVLGSAMYAVVLALPASAALIVTALLPFCSLMLLVYQEYLHPEEGVVLPDPAVAPESPRVSLRACFERVPWRIPAFVALSYFCFGATRMGALSHAMTADDLLGAYTVVIAMLACATGVALAFVSHRKSVQAGIYVAVPVMAAAGLCNLLGVPNAELVILYVANVGVEITKYIMLFLMIDVIIKDGAPALLCLALLRFAMWGGSALGQAVAGVLPNVVGVSVAMLVVLVVALLMVMGAFSGDGRVAQALRTATGRAAEKPAVSREPATAGQAQARAQARPGRAAAGGMSAGADGGTAVGRRAAAEGGLSAGSVEEAARRFGLSPRETEVLAIWATGRSAAYVEKALFIAQSTVKTHLNHIYAKTGTANRSELLELLDGLEVEERAHA